METEKAAGIVRKMIIAETGCKESDIAGRDLLDGEFGSEYLDTTNLIERIVVAVRDDGHEGFEFPYGYFDNYGFRTTTVDDMIKALALAPLRPDRSLSEVADQRLKVA